MLFSQVIYIACNQQWDSPPDSDINVVIYTAGFYMYPYIPTEIALSATMGRIWLPENTYLVMFQMPSLSGICMELRYLANAEPRGDSCLSVGAAGAWITYST